jgi:hypothetical protein
MWCERDIGRKMEEEEGPKWIKTRKNGEEEAFYLEGEEENDDRTEKIWRKKSGKRK